MVGLLPKQITPGSANRGSVVHSSDADIPGILSRRHTEEAISRLQSAFNLYDASLTYNLGDVVVEAGVRYSNTTPIITPEAFNPVNWNPFASPLTALEIEAQAVLGLLIDQSIAVSAVIAWDENFFTGDATKIIDEGSGVIRLHNGLFTLESTLALNITAGGPQSGLLTWQSSANVGGPFVNIPNPAGRAATYTTGNANVTTQPEAFALVDAQAADVFVRAVLDVTSSTDVLNAASKAIIQSFGTSAVANTPLTTKGDLLTHNGTSEQRLPVGADNEVIVADPLVALGIKWAPRGFEVIADETLGAVANTFNVTFPSREFLYIVLFLEASAGNLNAEFNFNDDFAGNYAFRREEDFGTTPTTETSANRVPLDPATIDQHINSTIQVFNQPGVESSYFTDSVALNGTSPTVLPATQRIKGIWYDVSDLVKLNVTTTINTFSTNSRIIVLGSHV